MAETFHFAIDIISRGKSQCAMNTSAYISGDTLHSDYDGQTYDHTRKERILHKEILLAKHIPEKFKDRQYLWNSVEMAEKNSNAQLARQFKIALPKELSVEENIELTRRFINENLTSEGMAVDFAIHDESQKGNKNIHTHILCIMRPINEKGQFTAKSKKEYILDENGEKIIGRNGKAKTRKINLVNWNDNGNAEKWRESFSNLCNEYLERKGLEKRVDHRSFKRQGLDKLPTIHLGAKASALERKGVKTYKGNINREIIKYNSLLEKVKEQISNFNKWIFGYVKELDVAYKNYVEDKRLEVENKSSLFNLYEYIDIYKTIQEEKVKHLSGYAKRNKEKYDSEKFRNAGSYLLSNDLRTIADLQENIGEVRKKDKKINKEIKEVVERIDKLEKCINYAKIIKENKSIFNEYKNKILFKEKFYKENKSKIDLYTNVTKQIQLITGEKKLETKKWTSEVDSLNTKLKLLNFKKDDISKDLEKINHIKYAVKTINNEYGIDLSIEIDKAVKRGEKESIIEFIKDFREEQIKSESKKEKTQKYYKNKDAER